MDQTLRSSDRSKDPGDESLQIIEDKGARAEPFTDEQVERLSALGQAISDPIRIRMLGMMAAGRECCSLPESGVPEKDMLEGLCVCEFEGYFGMGQSKVSYHMRKLKDAGLVRESRRGRWNYYSVDEDAAGRLLGEITNSLLWSGTE